MFKKILIIALLGAFLWTGTALAQINNLSDPGMLPDHPLYFLKRLGEAVGTFFTFGETSKAERHLFLAEKRVLEALALAEKGKFKAIETVLERHEEQLNLALSVAEEAKQRGLDVDEVLIEASRATLRHQMILIEIYEKVPEQARSAIERAMEVSIYGHQKVLEPITEQKKEQIKEEIAIKRWEVIQKAEEARKRVVEDPIELPEVFCPTVYIPVCGVDGNTYSNRCVAEMVYGVEIAYEGECGTSPIILPSDGFEPPRIERLGP